jgi:hypothetical protein
MRRPVQAELARLPCEFSNIAAPYETCPPHAGPLAIELLDELDGDPRLARASAASESTHGAAQDAEGACHTADKRGRFRRALSRLLQDEVDQVLGPEPTQVDLACAKTGIEKPASVPRVDPAGRSRRSAGAQQVDLEGIEDPIHRAGRAKLHRSGQPPCSQDGQHVIERATQMTAGPARDSASALGKVPVHEQRERRLIHRRRWNPLESQPVREVTCSNQVGPRDLRGVATLMQVGGHIIENRAKRPVAKAAQDVVAGEELLQHWCSFLARGPLRAPIIMLTSAPYPIPASRSDAAARLSDNSA